MSPPRITRCSTSPTTRIRFRSLHRAASPKPSFAIFTVIPNPSRNRALYGTESDSITKTLLYDSYYRLCRTTEPESGSTVMAYDGANNLAWSAQGQTITDGTCGQSDVPAAAQTVRTYDPMNRVLSITPPAGTQDTNYSYDLVGNILSVSTGVPQLQSQQQFTYNTRNMLTTEAMSVSGYAWALAYTYDGLRSSQCYGLSVLQRHQ